MGYNEYNGSAVVAMAGDKCVAIVADRRLGVNQFQTISTDFQKVFSLNERVYVGLPGLATDTQTVARVLKFRTNLYEMREERMMMPKVAASMVSSILYEHRFGPYMVGPVIAGLDENNNPHVAGFDLIGAESTARNFIVSGSSSEQLYGACESFYKEGMNPEELFECVSQCMQSALDRDCVAGWGAVVHIITPDAVITRTLKGRMD